MGETDLFWSKELPGEILEKWPRTDKGDFETAAFLTECSQLDMSDTIIISMLESYGIPCIKKYPHFGGFGNLMIGVSAEGVSLFVPESMLEDARTLMEEGGKVDE